MSALAFFPASQQPTSKTKTPHSTHDAEVVVYTGPDEEFQGREIMFGVKQRHCLDLFAARLANPKSHCCSTTPVATP